MAEDALARMGSDKADLPPNIFLQHLKAPSIKGGDVDYPHLSALVAILVVTPDWTLPYLDFLTKKEYPEGASEVKRR